MNRRAMAFNAALVPRLPAESIREEADVIISGLSDETSPDEVAKVEEENARLIAEREKRAAEVLAHRKGKPRPKRRMPKKVRKI